MSEHTCPKCGRKFHDAVVLQKHVTGHGRAVLVETPRNGKGSYKGFFHPSYPAKYKGNTDNIVFRSRLELKAMEYFDSHPDVLEWSSEEIVIPYMRPGDNKYHRYFIDFYVKCKTRDGQIVTYLVEVKPSAQTHEPPTPKRRTQSYENRVETYRVNQCKWAAAKQYCDKRTWTFMILTEKHLRN